MITRPHAPGDASPTPGTLRSWPELPAELRASAVLPDDPRYPRVRSSYMREGSPGLVVMAQHEDQVAEAVRYAGLVRHETGARVPFSVRSGGHGISGSSTNHAGIIVDLSQLNHTEVLDPASGRLLVQSGARWGDVAEVLSPHDLALSTGNFGDTGVGGLATAGGHGYFVRSQGMTLDHVRRVRLLTADGTIRWVDDTHDPDLFWAVRGGGAQAGIALAFEFEVPRLRSRGGQAHIIQQEIQYRIDDLPGFTEAWGDWMRQAPREAVSFLMLQSAGRGQYVASGRTVWANDDTSAALPTLRAAHDLAQVTDERAHIQRYTQIVPTPRSPHVGQQRIGMRNVLIDQATPVAGAALGQALDHPATLIGELRALGGAVSDIPEEATAWAGRHQEALLGIWAHPAAEADVDAAFQDIRALGSGAYGAYSSDTREAAADLAWPGATGARLRSIAQDADPEHLFDQGLTLRRSAPPSR